MCPDSEAISALRRGARCLRNRMLAPSSKRNRLTCSTCRRSEAENGGLRFPCLSAAWCSLSAHQAGCGDASLIVGVGAYLCLYGPNREHRVGEIMATVTQAYRFALDPTPAQRRALASHCGAARVAHNWGLALVKTRLDQRRTDPGVQVPWTVPELRREWNRVKDEVAPWWAENSKEAYSSGLGGLARALRNWSDSRSGGRKGRRSDSRSSRRRAVVGMPAVSPPARSRCWPTASTSSFPASASSRPTSRPASSPAAWSRAPPGFCPPPFPERPTAGSSPSPSRLNGRSRPPTGRRPRLEWTSASVTWPCSLLASLPSRTHELWSNPPEGFAGSTGN